MCLAVTRGFASRDNFEALGPRCCASNLTDLLVRKVLSEMNRFSVLCLVLFCFGLSTLSCASRTAERGTQDPASLQARGAPAPAPAPATVRAADTPLPSIYELLPAESHLVIAMVPEALDDGYDEIPLMASNQLSAFIQEQRPPVLQDLMGPDGIDLVDRGQRQLMAVTTATYRDLLASLRAGAPLMIAEEELPDGMHVRSIVETGSAEALAEALLARCAARSEEGVCEEFLETRATSDALVVDWIWGETNQRESQAGRSVAAALERMETAAPVRTVAWLNFEQTTGALALHTTTSALFDLAVALRFAEAREMLRHAVPEYRGRLIPLIGKQISHFLSVESPETAENYDVSLVLSGTDGALVFDAHASLTAYGREVSEAGNRPLQFSHQSNLNTFLELRGVFDLEAALSTARQPGWAAADLEVDRFANPTVNWAGLTGQVLLLQSPLTMLRFAFENFGLVFLGESIGELPSAFQDMRGFWLGGTVTLERGWRWFTLGGFQAIVGPDVDVEAQAEALRQLEIYPGEDWDYMVSMDRLDEDSSVRLGGSLVIEGESGKERIGVMGATMESFEARAENFAPGFTGFFDLRAFLEVLGNLPEMAPFREGEMARFVEEYGRVEAQLLTGEGQWRGRLQLGSGQMSPPALLLGGVEPPTVPPQGICAFQVTRASVDRLFGSSVTEYPEIAGEVLEAVRELASTCPDDEAAQARAAILIDAWEGVQGR